MVGEMQRRRGPAAARREGIPLVRATEKTYKIGLSGVVAQLGERRNRTAEVEGSTPFDSTTLFLSDPETKVTVRT
ncbi:hypothetical protein EMEDMD4_160010 [Sinorhizobium medicae]|uniref:Uncharacterized protein n=1 Tax=Sinorhizobium medicae TaxID=110321 RepID=A0A508WUG4_9HYPH|nr:hypothetical protein EMEDMD4_160010 [Sinorhizobium medicae]